MVKLTELFLLCVHLSVNESSRACIWLTVDQDFYGVINIKGKRQDKSDVSILRHLTFRWNSLIAGNSLIIDVNSIYMFYVHSG